MVSQPWSAAPPPVRDDGGAQRPIQPLDPLGFDAVLFDMDGIPIDSEPRWYEAIIGVVPAYWGCCRRTATRRRTGREISSRVLRDQFALQGDIDACWFKVVARLGVALATVKPPPIDFGTDALCWTNGLVACSQPTRHRLMHRC